MTFFLLALILVGELVWQNLPLLLFPWGSGTSVDGGNVDWGGYSAQLHL